MTTMYRKRWRLRAMNWRGSYLFGFTIDRTGCYVYLFRLTLAIERRGEGCHSGGYIVP